MLVLTFVLKIDRHVPINEGITKEVVEPLKKLFGKGKPNDDDYTLEDDQPSKIFRSRLNDDDNQL